MTGRRNPNETMLNYTFTKKASQTFKAHGEETPGTVKPNNTLKPIAGRPRLKSPEETKPKSPAKSVPKYTPMQPKLINAKLHGRSNVKFEETEVNQCQMTGSS